jgi:hypothetical protein
VIRWQACVVATALLACASANAAMLATQAELKRDAGMVSLNLDFPATVKYKVFPLTAPNRLVIDLQGVGISAALDRLSSKPVTPGSGITGIRIGHPDADTTRIVLDLKSAPPKAESRMGAFGNKGMQRLSVRWQEPGKGVDFAKGTKVAQAPSATVSDVSHNAAAGKRQLPEWSFKATPQLTYGTYRSAPTRDRMTSYGVFADGQYFDQGGVSAGVSHSDLTFKNGATTLRQDNYFLSGRMNFTPDTVPGSVTVRADGHYVKNNDATNETSNVRVFAPQVSFLSYDKTHYFDLGYARSGYGESTVGNGSLAVDQWTPTAGFALNEGVDWVQLRLYNIRAKNAVTTSSTDSLEAKRTQYPMVGPWSPQQVQLGALMGKRRFAVDADSASVYNLADMQRGGVSAGAQWQIAPDARVLLSGGYDRYETQGGGTGYSGTYIYTGLTTQW